MSTLEEFIRRVDRGWVPYGWHVHPAYKAVKLEYDGKDDSGFPIWERAARLTFTELDDPYANEGAGLAAANAPALKRSEEAGVMADKFAAWWQQRDPQGWAEYVAGAPSPSTGLTFTELEADRNAALGRDARGGS